MATVKRNNPAEPETPSQTLVRNALRAEEILDSNGRRIMLRNPGPLAQFRLVQAAGAEAAGNPTYMAMALPLIYVGSIDGAPVPDVMTKAHLEALIQRLDDAGIAAVMENVARIYGRQDPEADKETLKN